MAVRFWEATRLFGIPGRRRRKQTQPAHSQNVFRVGWHHICRGHIMITITRQLVHIMKHVDNCSASMDGHSIDRCSQRRWMIIAPMDDCSIDG